MDTLVNVIILAASLFAIVGLIIGATTKINELMIGNKMSFLENKKRVFEIALIFIGLYLSAILFGHLEGFVYYWYDFLSFAFSIALIFAIGKYMPGLITFLRELHQSNLECAQELELMNEEQKDL
jgi:hypothetical protein